MKEKFTSPLGLRRRQMSFPLSFDGMIWIDLVVIVMLMKLLSSEYLFLPGLGLELPTQSNEVATFKSPAATITLLNPTTVIFQHQSTNWKELPPLLKEYIANNPDPNKVLMVKMSRSVSVELLLKATNMAKNAGFKTILLPTEDD